MNARAYRLDLESQVAEANDTDRRDRHREAARYDRGDWVRINGQTYEADRVPDLGDVVDLGENS